MPDVHAPVRTSSRAAVGIAIAALLGFVIESQASQYVQATLGYRQPFFLFYMVHSSFAIIFPLHLLSLVAISGYTLSGLLNGLRMALVSHLSRKSSQVSEFPTRRFAYLMAFMLVGVTMPGLLWFAALTLSPLGDVTALWNANAFFAYVFNLKLLGMPLEPRKLGAVLLATSGVLAVVYGGSQAEVPSAPSSTSSSMPGVSRPLVGDLLTLVASVLYGLYQVLYKKYASFDSEAPPVAAIVGSYRPIDSDVDDREAAHVPAYHGDAVYPPPFGLFPNFLTAVVGLLTIVVLGLLIPVLDWAGFEHFRAPPDLHTFSIIATIALSGVVFNAGFMILLGVWGPVVTSVGGLITIVLMFASDAVFGGAAQTVTSWSLSGSAVIIIAFGVLAHDILTAT